MLKTLIFDPIHLNAEFVLFLWPSITWPNKHEHEKWAYYNPHNCKWDQLLWSWWEDDCLTWSTCTPTWDMGHAHGGNYQENLLLSFVLLELLLFFIWFPKHCCVYLYNHVWNYSSSLLMKSWKADKMKKKSLRMIFL